MELANNVLKDVLSAIMILNAKVVTPKPDISPKMENVLIVLLNAKLAMKATQESASRVLLTKY